MSVDLALLAFALLCTAFLNGSNMQARQRDAPVVVEPHHDPGASRIDARMIRAGNPVPFATACNNEKRLKWASVEQFTNTTYHATYSNPAASVGQASDGKLSAPAGMVLRRSKL